MNDLAEKALDGLRAARRQVRERPLASFALTGFLLGAVVVAAGGKVGAARSSRPLTTWLGLQNSHRAESSDAVPAAIMLGAVAALVVLWVAVVRYVRRSPASWARVWVVAAAWWAPFALGPPLVDTGVYSSAAYGLLQRAGYDPHSVAPSRLGGVPVVAAIDPGSRGTPSAAGPVATVLQHIAVSIGNGSALGAVLVLRVVGVLALISIGRSAAQLAGRRGDRALTLTALNPLALLYLISAAHLDGLMLGLVLAGLVAARGRRWSAAVTWVALAGSVSAQAFVVLPAAIAVHAAQRGGSSPWRRAGRDTAVAAVVIAVCGAAVPNGFGWVRAIGQQFAAHTPFSVAGAIGAVLRPAVPGASYDDLAIGARVTVTIAMVCVVGYLLATARGRPLERTAGYALLAVGLLAPVLYAWYVLWGVLCVAARASGAQLLAVVALSAGGCALAPPGFGETTRDVLTAVALVALGAAVCAVSVASRRCAHRVPAPS